jgi:hypothetical protein
MVPDPDKPAASYYTLSRLDDLAGFVAAESNHAKNKKLGREWDELYDGSREFWKNTFTLIPSSWDNQAHVNGNAACV